MQIEYAPKFLMIVRISMLIWGDVNLATVVMN